jgi:2-oxoglutarate dehydrogenase complex dehydrogenase (E1) component-like enzyme
MARSSSEGDPCQEPTGLPLTTLQRVGRAICEVPPGFNAHPDVSTLQLLSRPLAAPKTTHLLPAQHLLLAMTTMQARHHWFALLHGLTNALLACAFW